MKSERTVKKYMRAVIENHIDARTGEVNTTGMGEAACDEFDDYYGDDFAIPEEYFDWAFETAEALGVL